MYAGNTLFVVGAGASFELGFPLGATLKDEITRCLAVKMNNDEGSDYGRVLEIRYNSPNDNQIYKFIYNKSVPYFDPRFESDARSNVQKEMAIWKQVAHGVHFAASIDNYLHNRRGNADVVQVGKAAIAWVIAQEEQKLGRRAPTEWLKTTDRDVTSGPAKTKTAWTTHFAEQCFSLVEEDPEQKHIAAALSKTRFIVFNYDRCVEQFISLALQGLYAMEKGAAEAVVNDVDIFHPYGDLGLLAVEPFGTHPPNVASKSRIKTFTEGMGSEEDRDRIAKSIAWADTIVFLGFGYIAQNMKLLKHPAKDNVRIFGTTLGLSDAAQTSAEESIADAFSMKPRAAKASILLKRSTCAELLVENAVTLVATG